LEGVRDRHAGKAELLPQELLQDSRAQRRLLVVECWHADVRSHDRAYAGGDRRAEGLECLVQVAAYHRQLEMGVLRRIAVAWKVLGGRGYALTLKALHERRDMTSNEGGLGAERANPDHGVVGIRVDVCDRREVEVDADRGQFVRDRSGGLLCQIDVVDRAKSPVSRVRAAGSRLEASDVAAFFVGCDE